MTSATTAISAFLHVVILRIGHDQRESSHNWMREGQVVIRACELYWFRDFLSKGMHIERKMLAVLVVRLFCLGR